MRRRTPLLVAVLGLGLVVAGVVTFAVANGSGTPHDVGWAAYTPLASESAYRSELTLSFDGGWAVYWTGQHLAGALLAGVGLLLLAGVGGWWLGRRSSAQS
jgi:heme/copper-type cytochrome/quinol oxidase subunit 1